MSEQHENLTGVRLPPPMIALIHLLAAFLFGWILPLPIPAPAWLAVLGAVIVIAGLALAGWAIDLFRTAGTTLNPRGGTTRLVDYGPYRFTRNPIYLANICFLAGFPLIIHDYWGLILVQLLIFVTNKLVIEREEAYLAQLLGQPYLDYKSRVRRWL